MINIADYPRPGIYTNYIDNSGFQTPLINLGTQVLILGVSKRGPVNTPIIITSQADLERVFGDLDRNLENKGSFFHRAISRVIQSAPVVAMNIFNPDDTLDVLEYKSLSTSTGFFNDIKRTGAYRRFFDTSMFWKRDRESFLSITDVNAGSENRVLHMTNISDREVTVFVVKSTRQGFDVRLDEWYGKTELVPNFVSVSDFASDYMVDVYVVAGNWTNYQSLSFDTKWSRYFNNEGLIKGEIVNFVNDNQITTLARYDGLSLIPYFRDNRGDIFIETRINRDTTSTGVFCSVNIGAISTDFRNGLIDLVGNNLIADDTQTNINFLSYQDSIVEDVTYNRTSLDRPGNVFGIAYDSNVSSASGRGGLNVEGIVTALEWSISDAVSMTPSASPFVVTPEVSSATAIMNGKKLFLNVDANDNDISISPASLGVGTGRVAIFIDTDGLIKTNPNTTQATNGIILGYLEYTVNSSLLFTNAQYVGVSVNSVGEFIPFTNNTNVETGIQYSVSSNTSSTNDVTYTFFATSGTISPMSFHAYRKIKAFNNLVSTLSPTNINKTAILVDSDSKIYGSDLTLTSNTTGNKSITISGVDNTYQTLTLRGLFVYNTDDEFILGIEDIRTQKLTAATNGVVAKYSKFYIDFIDGFISTGDKFTFGGNNYKLKMFKTLPSGDLMVQYLDEDGILVPSISDFNGTVTSLIVTTKKGNFRQSVEVEEIVAPNKVRVRASRYSEVRVGDFLWADIDVNIELEIGEVPRMATRILTKRSVVGNPNLVELTCDAPINIIYEDDTQAMQTYRFSKIDDFVSTYKGISLFGFRYRKESLPDGTEQRMTDILQIVGRGTPLFKSITDKNLLDVRYLVDSFGLGLTSESKRELADICGSRKDLYGILSMPSMKMFRKSASPRFVDNENRLIPDFIRQGGDPEASPAFLYSFVTDPDSASTCGYFTPYFVVNDNGRPLDVPPAPFVATNFLRKHLNPGSPITPWTINAGLPDGLITGIGGLEMDFNGDFITALNQMKANPVVVKGRQNNRRFAIETDNTALVGFNSALAYTHVREVLIELERALKTMLDEFQWKYNTPEIRAEIKLRADAICEDFSRRNGIFNFFNKCDGENNTREIIENQIGVLDTFIEPIFGMGIIVNNITVERPNTIVSSGFGIAA